MTNATNSPGRQVDAVEAPAELLTQDEAVRLLRLDALGLKDPRESLRHLRRTRQIGYVKVAGKVLIPRAALREYLARQAVQPLGVGAALDGRSAVGSNAGRGDPEPHGGR